MKKTIFALVSLLLFVLSPIAHAAPTGSYNTFDVSIDRVTANDAVVIESRNNLVTDINAVFGPNVFVIGTEITALTNLNGARIEVILKGKRTGLTVSDATGAFDFLAGSLSGFFRLQLTDGMTEEKEFELVVRVTDVTGKKEEKKYSLSTESASKSSNDFDISLNRVIANGQPLAFGRNNFMGESDFFNILVDFTALSNTDNVHVEAVLRDLRTGNVMADSTGAFDIEDDTNYLNFLFVQLIDPLSDSGSYDLTIKIVDEDGKIVQRNYGIRMDDDLSSSNDFDVSINRVTVNNKVVAQSSTNLLDEEDEFDVIVDITALEDLEEGHVEVIMKDKNTGHVVADSTGNFFMPEDSSTSTLLSLELIDDMKKSSSFDLTVRVVDAEGHSTQKIYGITMDGSTQNGKSGSLDLSIDRVEIEDKIITQDQTNFILIGTQKGLDLDVAITALEDIEKARVEAVLTYENGDVVSDTTTNFDISDDESRTRRLELPLVAGFEESIFRLKLKISDAEGDFVEKFYTLRLTKNSFPIMINSMEASPSKIEAGKSVVVDVNMQNSGIVSLKGMTATVSIPELGISDTRFITKNDKEFTEEFILQIPQNTEAGQYTIIADVMQQFGSEKESRQATFNVVEKTSNKIEDRLIITVPVNDQKVGEKKESVYPLIFRNEGPSSTYTLSVDGKEWADTRLDGSNAFILKTGETKTLNLYVRSNGEEEGKQTFTVTVSTKGNELKQLTLKADLGTTTPLSIKAVLMWSLIVIVMILALAGAFIGIKDSIESDEEESGLGYSEPSPYY